MASQTEKETVLVVQTDDDVSRMAEMLSEVVPGQFLAAGHTYQYDSGDMRCVVMAGTEVEGRIIVVSVETWNDEFESDVPLSERRVFWMCQPVPSIQDCLEH